MRAGSGFGRKNRRDSRIEKEKQVGRQDLRTLSWTLPFPTLLYTSTSELPTLSYTWDLKKVPLLGGASPLSHYREYPPPPRHILVQV